MKHLPSPAEVKEGAVILIDKPTNWTSFDAINSVKRLLHVKIGHCGTLDPLASGLLICCTGKMTKQISDYQRLPKEYTGIIHLGATTASHDRETEPEDFKPFEHITTEAITEAAKKFTGDIMQTPPIHSAIKVDGKRAYKLARKGREIKLDARPVTIAEFEITRVDLPEVHFRVLCSTGTYIRALAHDMGQELGCGAYLQELTRTKIGSFKLEDALSPKEWKEHWKPTPKVE